MDFVPGLFGSKRKKRFALIDRPDFYHPDMAGPTPRYAKECFRNKRADVVVADPDE
jgi:hypothetical protein